MSLSKFNRDLAKAIKEISQVTPVKISGRWTREIIGCQLKLDPQLIDSSGFPIDERYAAAQLVWYCAAERDLWIKQFNPDLWARFNSPHTNGKLDLNSNYGIEIFKNGQFERCIQQLEKDPFSRQAVILLNRSEILASSTKDHVCTTSLQFLIRNNRLVLISTMRSNEVWNGLRYDAFFFRHLQENAAVRLGVIPGDHIHQVGSLHIYEENWDRSASIILFPSTYQWPAISAQDAPRIHRKLASLKQNSIAVTDVPFITSVSTFLKRHETEAVR